MKVWVRYGALWVLLGFCSVIWAAKPATQKEQFSYTIGYRFATDIQNQGLDLDAVWVGKAISHVLNGQSLDLSDEQMNAAMEAYKKERLAQLTQMGNKNLQTGQAYLEKNGTSKGVVTLDNGMQYKIIVAGKGKKPKPEDKVVVHYKGTLIDGTEFDSSYKRGQPASFNVNGVIQGWQQALVMMSEGSKWELAIPPHLAYGARGSGPQIGPNETLLFEVELLEVK
jgi:FKBP-type peptidyl-prolyl cis-trans isomerase FklB